MIIAFIIAAFVVIIDQISKHIVKTNMQPYESFNFIPNVLNIRYIENEGASFGILKDHRWVFMSLSLIALSFMFVIIIYLGRKALAKHNLWVNTSLALMFGGGMGNMIDRLFNESMYRSGLKVVVDFLEFDFVDFAIFNFADTFITIGSVFLCVCGFTGKYKLDNKSDKIIKEESEADDIAEEFLEDSGEDIK